MLVPEEIYSELMTIKGDIEKLQKGRRRIDAMVVYLPIRDKDGLYKSIENNYWNYVSTMMGRMIICFCVYDPAKKGYGYMTTKEFKKFMETDMWKNQ